MNFLTYHLIFSQSTQESTNKDRQGDNEDFMFVSIPYVEDNQVWMIDQS